MKKSRARRPKPVDEDRPQESSGGQSPAGITAGGQIDPEKILPLNPWKETIGLALDAATAGLRCPVRAENEKTALAVTSRNWMVLKTGRAESAPGIAFAAVAGSLAVSILYDFLQRIKRDREDAKVTSTEQTHGSNGKIGIRKEPPNKESTQPA